MDRPWLQPSLVVLQVSAGSQTALVDVAAVSLAGASGLEMDRLRDVFNQAFQTEGYSLGSGVAIPHVEVDGLEQTLVCLVTSKAPIPLETVDGVPPDVFFFILSRRDPRGHLVLLAHLASLARSRSFLAGLREARTPDEVMTLVDAAERRHAPSTGRAQDTPATSHVLVLVSVSGERLVDAILVDLVDRGFDDASVIEAQSLRDAAAQEVPLFAGFRDIFGDPGGRRLLVVEAPSEQAQDVVDVVRQLCEEHRSHDAAVTVVPVQMRWRSPRPQPREASGAH